MEKSDNTVVVEVDPATDMEYDYPKQPKPWLFQPGKSYNPGGRPPGKTLKQWTREYLASLSDEERLAYLKGIPKVELWRMAEGNPTEDKNITVSAPTPILGGIIIENGLDTPQNAALPEGAANQEKTI